MRCYSRNFSTSKEVESFRIFPDLVLLLGLGHLRITVSNTLPSQPPCSSLTLQGVEFPRECANPSHTVPVVSLGAPSDDQMLIPAWEGELMSSGDEDSAVLPPCRCGNVARVRSRADANAFPGYCDHWARVEPTTISQTLAAGLLVSWGSLCWFSTLHPSAFLSRSA